MLRLFNTLTRKIEEFKPLKPPIVGFYSCGPTVYDYAHIGHARTYIFSDTLQRILEFNGYQVKRVMNITDVGHLTSDADSGEDKMEWGAKREKKSVWEIADYYTEDFLLMLNDLNIKKPKIITRATDYIPQMIELVRILEEKGFTYKVADGIYFDTSKLKDYGKLSGKTLDELQSSLKAGARIEMVKDKKNVTDFALWKLTPVGVKRQMEWDSPWGKGYPGWHLECSAMGIAQLGKSFDIHTGGVDHIQIHHTNEIAQSEAATGKPFVKYWLHAGHLTVEGEKMSKSLGNYFRVSDLIIKGFEPLALRYLFLTASYRKEMNFTWESMKAAQSAFVELKDKISEIKNSVELAERTSLSEEKLVTIDELRNKFTSSINNDLNTAEGIALLWQVVKSNVPPADKLDLIYLFDEVLGLKLNQIRTKEDLTIPDHIAKLAEDREKARKQKNFKEADQLRKMIEKAGYILEDLPSGPRIKLQ
ncbi:cysteine--tRNA ligase [Candidatus Gottesmanbacteria bacterium RBG_16_37_8]|uniref:Cysteine--tRNA ligase n=1 Tax=Candidatus Gottesmanbacteria bacterium RBG_16_37_8 TaxID=1798371 RepID=A0A1F5YSC3_9BACT|nr:MAG: cysteine--tRNA ligase [Candidatus Gottesmanbacteria bacterium RBG_16_37_8]